ncbi:hypothetical protein CDL12_13297 [Handroanthus impetiginosus]|uniref:Uncharacterized protein n=1 Tax=Handroanthus impetiginosus TaxID=429701 RepID=A0A2G9H9T7_9LAMI|nr:hypothetical protein CDL12_13297 [Handroanthus impetiginosus]
MSMSSSSIAATSTIFKHRHPPPIATPCTRFFRITFAAKTHLLWLSSANFRHASRLKSSDSNGSSVEKQGSNGKDENFRATSSNEILNKLRRYGVSGILSYGLLNTAYYLTTFLVVWFLKVMAMVWAGSQVTKLIRAGGALALAPFVDRGLSWFTVKFGFESQGKAFMAIAGLCFGLAFLMFVIVTLLWA